MTKLWMIIQWGSVSNPGPDTNVLVTADRFDEALDLGSRCINEFNSRNAPARSNGIMDRVVLLGEVDLSITDPQQISPVWTAADIIANDPSSTWVRDWGTNQWVSQ